MKKVLLLIAVVLAVAMSSFLPIQSQAPSVRPTFTITVNYNLPLADQIKAGKFDRVHPGFTDKNFPSTESGIKQVTVELLTIPRSWIKTDQVERYIESQGCRSATLPELLAFAATYPNEWRFVNLVAALGSPWVRSKDVTDVPIINVADGKRWLWPRPQYHQWVDTQKFLVVKK